MLDRVCLFAFCGGLLLLLSSRPRPAAGAVRSAVATTRKRGAPAVTSPVRRAAPSAALPAASQTYPARLAADGASFARHPSIRSWPALTGAVSLPGFPTSAEYPAGGPDPLSTSSGAGFGLATLAPPWSSWARWAGDAPARRGRASSRAPTSRSSLRLATSGDVVHVLELATKERST